MNNLTTERAAELRALSPDDRERLLQAHKAELARLGNFPSLTGPQVERSEQLLAEFDVLERAQRLALMRAAVADPRNLENGFGGAPAGAAVHASRDSGRDAAMRTIDDAVRTRHLPAHAAEKVERLVTQGSDGDRSVAARWAVAAGNPAYERAFSKLLGDPDRGHMLWTAQEQAAWQDVAAVRTAMSLTDANGGYMVPLTLDPAILLSSDGSINPLRKISRVVQTVTDGWQGVTSAGATAEWKSEGSQAADGSPTVGSAPIPVHFGDVFVPYSYEIGMDGASFLRELTKVMVDAADQLMATAYTTGSGSGQPTGFVTALAGTSSEINSGGTEAIIAADAYSLQNALPPRFQANAKWVANIATINTFAQFETTAGALKFPEVRSDQLLRKPLFELSNMDGSINAAATASNYVLAYGDWSNFVIVDRIGSQIELIPNLVGANGRPTGQRGAFLWFRTGSDVVVNEAFRLLDVPTTA